MIKKHRDFILAGYMLGREEDMPLEQFVPRSSGL